MITQTPDQHSLTISITSKGTIRRKDSSTTFQRNGLRSWYEHTFLITTMQPCQSQLWTNVVHQNLTYASESAAVLKVDTSVGPGSLPDASTGRFSVRVESKRQYNKGLFIFDVRHTPYGCGTWPALWLTDQSNWPNNGEIDVMEAVNQATDGNQMTLHTTKGCSVDGVRRKMTGSSLNANC